MRVHEIPFQSSLWRLLIVLSALLFSSNESFAAQLQLNWADNSTNETGFTIERKTGVSGAYAEITSVAADITSYTDSTVVPGTNYCYRLYAFNTAGNSPYTPEVCGSAPTPVQSFTLAVVKAGTGSGTITSSPAGINCASTCSKAFNSGTAVIFTATPAAGSVFTKWTGTGCGANGSVTISANITCTATFNLQPVSTFMLTVAKAGTGSGTITSSPAGLNCTTSCSKTFDSGTAVILTATPAAGSAFSGWSGTGCGASGSVTISANITCTATFKLQPVSTFTLTVAKAGTGSGTITSSPGGINCSSTCSGTYNDGATVVLTATPAAKSEFVNWTGTGCSSTAATINILISVSRSCTATFNSQTNPLMAKIGVFRPSSGQWFLDTNGNGIFDNCDIDTCVTGYGTKAMLPVVADWEGTGHTSIGVFDPDAGTWHLDNGNGKWDLCEPSGDTCVTTYGTPNSLPVVKELSSERLVIGTFQSQVTTKINRKTTIKQGVWNFDLDGDGNIDKCGTDECIENFGQAADLPITGDWNGTGAQEIGVFRPSTGRWYLDLNGNGKWDGSKIDRLVGPFGLSEDRPIVGDWDGMGKVRIGIYRPSTGQWFLDINGNGKLDNCATDACLGPFGQAGDLPVVGLW